MKFLTWYWIFKRFLMSKHTLEVELTQLLVQKFEFWNGLFLFIFIWATNIYHSQLIAFLLYLDYILKKSKYRSEVKNEPFKNVCFFKVFGEYMKHFFIHLFWRNFFTNFGLIIVIFKFTHSIFIYQVASSTKFSSTEQCN